jgi:basic membrane lipoprotein Med (substrate-binding protein (PBP1-ABC) superfamily)/DNA-binding SARP family transcriptional activator/energy-coupling factor transporter ATP-binding protein EcfA2
VEYRMLGPLEVIKDGASLDLGPHKQRSLLALLLVNANHTVTTDRILEELWGDEAEGKENALWVYISRLRSALGEEHGEAKALLTKDGGYSLAVDPPSIDSLRFESEAVSGRAAMKDDPEAASEVLGRALSLWRGDVLEDFRYDEFAQAEISRLDELRVAAIEDRIEAELRLGGSGELISELDTLTEANPLRERPISLKMLALYRAGRQAEALRTFEQFRRSIGEEMGIDPSPELVRLEEQILLHDSRLKTTMRTRATTLPTDHAVNPFKGLQPFQEADAEHFFGRDRLVADVVRRISDQRMVTLVGPSGSGKSSVVRAGVIPALRKNAIPDSDRWLIAQMVPGSRPFDELEAALLRSTIDAPDSLSDQLRGGEPSILRAALRVLPEDTAKIIIVIDQFEELFTLVTDETTRTRFLDQLTEVVDDPHGRIRVLLTLRADFYDRPLQYPAFGARMGDGVVNVVPMAPDELEYAAERPAARAGVTLEPSLLASLLTDVVGQPGALPLFQYTLTELFDRRNEGNLSLDVYDAMGGLRGTLTRRADELFGELTASQAAAARQLFLRLVTIADTDEWSRRRVRASEILALDIDVVDLQAVIGAYGTARLLTFDRDHVSGSPTVEVAHEALLTEWERLRDWIDEARDDVRRQVRLAAAGAEWHSSGGNPDYLLSGSRLQEYEVWATLTTLSLTRGERAYLDASVTEREAIATVETERASREVALDRRARRRLWGLAAAVVVLAGIGLALILAALAPDPPTIALVGIRSGSVISDQLVNGFEQAARELEFTAEQLFPTSDPPGELADMLDTNPDMVLTSFGSDFEQFFGESVGQVAARYPDTLFVGEDFEDLAGPAPNTLELSYRVEEGSFLVGAAAALTSETGQVGFVGADPQRSIERFRAGFEAGAVAVRDDITVECRYLSSFPSMEAFENPELGRLAAEVLYDRGADVIYTAAGFAGTGTLTAATEGSAAASHLWAIGVDVDESIFTDPRERDHLLTSMVIRRDNAIRHVIGAFIDGSLEPGSLELGMAEDVIEYSSAGEHLDPAVIERLDTLRADISNGVIIVPDVPARRADECP